VDRGIVPDDPRAIRRSINQALAQSDFVITLGGTSVGRHDDVGDALRSLRPSVLFHGLKMDRGRVTGVAVVGGKPLLMAPGPIQGGVNAFILLGIPIIRRLAGAKQREFLMPCKLGSDWVARERFADFQKVVYVKLSVGAENTAEPLWGETESLKVLTDADGYIWIPEGVTRLTAGSDVTVRMLPGFSGF
jgi:molybdopterin biosynthesis enzyme